ncbi:MAG TPA: PhnD/SsuA/transferrin family substrate-binding protein, partial [Thermoanaerobaculia bacterium]|nr:PhnD/SsuA/transferrin family substrate-binding protein [Thermoanaerobaculia bacterium]
NTLWLKRREDPSLGARLRVIESWGPSPIQPLLVREPIPPPVRARIVEALLTLDAVPGLPERLGVFGLQRFVLVEEADYAAVRPAATISMVI